MVAMIKYSQSNTSWQPITWIYLEDVKLMSIGLSSLTMPICLNGSWMLTNVALILQIMSMNDLGNINLEAHSGFVPVMPCITLSLLKKTHLDWVAGSSALSKAIQDAAFDSSFVTAHALTLPHAFKVCLPNINIIFLNCNN